MKTRLIPFAALLLLFTSKTLLAADMECSLKTKNKASGRTQPNPSLGVVSKLYEEKSATANGYKVSIVKLGEDSLGMTVEDLKTDTSSSAVLVRVSSTEPTLAFRSDQGLSRSVGVFCRLMTGPSAK